MKYNVFKYVSLIYFREYHFTCHTLDLPLSGILYLCRIQHFNLADHQDSWIEKGDIGFRYIKSPKGRTNHSRI